MNKSECARKVCEALRLGESRDSGALHWRQMAQERILPTYPVTASALDSAADWLERWGAAAEAPDAMGEMVEAAAQAYAASGGGAGGTAEARRDNIAACLLNVAEGLPMVACRAAALKAIAAAVAALAKRRGE